MTLQKHFLILDTAADAHDIWKRGANVTISMIPEKRRPEIDYNRE